MKNFETIELSVKNNAFTQKISPFQFQRIAFWVDTLNNRITLVSLVSSLEPGAVKSHSPNYIQMSGKNIEPADRWGITSGVVICLMK